MTWFYAALCRVFGIDVIYFRYALLVGSLVAVLAWYFIARRFGNALEAASAAFVALLWSFPNYFAGLPSWWNVIFGSCSALFLIRFAERRRIASLLVAGLFCGIACTFKQTGVYLVGAAILAILYDEQADAVTQGGPDTAHPSAWFRAIVVVGAVSSVLVLLVSRLSPSAFALLALPPIAISVALFLDEQYRRDEGIGRLRVAITRLAVFGLGVLVPIAIWLIPYATRGAWRPLIRGTLVMAQNFSRVVAYETPSLWLALGLVPLFLFLGSLLPPPMVGPA